MCRPRYKKCVPAAGRAQCGGSCVRSWLLLEQRRLRCAAISALVRPFSLGGKWRTPGAFCGGLRCCAAFGGFDYFFFPPGLAARPGNAQARTYLHCAWQSFVHALITRWEHCPSHGRFVWQSVPFEFE